MKNCGFEEALVSCMPLLRKYAWKLTRNNLKADELTQDTLCRALYKKHLYRQEDNFRGWLLIMMRNIFINQHHKAGKRKLVEFEEVIASPEHAIVEERATNKIDIKYVKDVVQQLNPKMKIALVLYSTGYHYEEIATMLNESIGTIKSRIFIARKSMLKIKSLV